MKQVSLILFSFLSFNCYSQSLRIQDKFLMELAQENIIQIKDSSSGDIKDFSGITMEIDSLGTFDGESFFYQFKIGSNAIIIKDPSLEVTFYSSSCNEYIIAYNLKRKSIYKLKGFMSNDLIFLIRDIKTNLSNKKKDKEIIQMLSYLHINIDFARLYLAISKKNFDDPTLKVCTDGISAHKRL